MMDEEEIKEVSLAMAQLGRVPATLVEQLCSEFVDGMRDMGCETIDQLHDEMRRVKERLLDDAHRGEYKEFFAFVFHFVRRTHETNRRTIPMDTACRLLESLLRARYGVHVDRLCRYMRELGGVGARSTVGRVTFDQWQSLLEWCENMDVEYLQYDEDNSCWPVLLDEFISWMRQTDKPTMTHYEAKRQERITQRQPSLDSSASSDAAYPAYPYHSDSIVDRITRLHMQHSSSSLDATKAADSAESLPTPRRSSLSVRVPRPSSIEAVSLDSDDLVPSSLQPALGGGAGGGMDGGMLSRSLPSTGALGVLQRLDEREQHSGRTFGWDRGEAMND